MKRFIVSILGVTVFCIGLGALADKAGATFKSDEKALAIIRQARLAIGGDQSIAEVRSMIIKGNTTVTFRTPDGGRTEQGETEIAMQLPDKMSKMVRIGRPDGNGEEMNHKVVDVMVVRKSKGEGEAVAAEPGKQVILRKVDGGNGEEKVILESKDGEFTTSDGKTIKLRKHEGPIEEIIVTDDGAEKGKRIMIDGDARAAHEAHRQNELLRTTVSLLLTAPEGMDVNYTFVGEGDVDGATCNIINAEFGGSSFKLYLSKASSLPVMVSYLGHAMPNVMFFRTKAPEDAAAPAAPAEPMKDKVMTWTRTAAAPAMSEIQVKFSDYRSVNGVQLPYKWTTSTGGKTTEVFDVTGYEINPANIAEKFKHERTFVRTQKES
jgi:hypothetical protein